MVSPNEAWRYASEHLSSCVYRKPISRGYLYYGASKCSVGFSIVSVRDNSAAIISEGHRELPDAIWDNIK